MQKTAPTVSISYKSILSIALPVMLANIAVPIQSMIDTAIVGNLGEQHYISALGLAGQIIMLIIGSFYFLQASTTGITAQALGRFHTNSIVESNAISELTLILLRSSAIALVLAIGFILCQSWLVSLMLTFFDASQQTNGATEQYLSHRFLGFPAELINYVLFGWFAGIGRTRLILIQQFIISLSNVIFSLLFVYVMKMALTGVALGTVMAQYLGMFVSIYMAYMAFNSINQFKKQPNNQQNNQLSNQNITNKQKSITDNDTKILSLFKQVLDVKKIKSLFSLNGNIFIRSLLLTLSFTWITKLATMQGDDFLASNVILLSVLTISAFALDGIAIAAKTLVGQIYGNLINNKNTSVSPEIARQKFLFHQAIKNTGITTLLLAVCLSIIWLLVFDVFINMMTNITTVQNLASKYIIFACLLPVVGAAAYWLDGVFFGLADGTAIRQAMIIVALIFFPASYILTEQFSTVGVWLSIYLLLLLRALILVGFLWRRYL